MSEVFSIVALVVSVGTFIFVARTYWAQYRPYVGIVTFKYEFAGNPPTSMRWKFGLKNVGSLPASMEFEEISVSLRKADHTDINPVTNTFGNRAYLMPEQICYISANVQGGGGVAAILDGTTTLEVNVRLNYNRGGWWKTKYRYASTYRFLPLGNLSDFLLVSVDAN